MRWYAASFLRVITLTSCDGDVRLRDTFKENTNLEDEIHHSTHTSQHEGGHHPLFLIASRQVSLEEEKEREGKSGVSDVVFPVILIED